VYELSGRETADAVGTSEGNVKVLLHRARAAMARHDASRTVPTPERSAQTQQALMAFLTALASGDADAMTAALSKDIVMANDGGGEFSAARKLVVGRARVVRFHLKVSGPGVPQVRLTELNGVPGLIVARPPAPAKPPPRGRGPRQPVARRFVMLVDGGQTLTHLWLVLATPKLAGLSFPGLEPANPS
jgi:RNA polymerase sigma-70 factor (ECF subfamily)